MQTIYYSTNNFIQHNSNIVDLGEYRRKLALAEEGSLAPQPETEYTYDFPWAEAESRPQPVLREVPRTTGSTRRQRRERRAWMLDACASLGVVVMTLTFTLQILL